MTIAPDSPLWLKVTKDGASVVQSVATVVALIVGAWWVLRRRKTYPRAIFTHAVSHVQLNAEVVLLRLSVAIENIGDVLLPLEKSIGGVQQVSPIPDAVKASVANRRELVGSAITEFDWPFIDSRQRNWSGHHVEPGESAAFDFELLVPVGITHVLVYTYFRNVTRPGDTGWNTSTLYNVTTAGT